MLRPQFNAAGFLCTRLFVLMVTVSLTGHAAAPEAQAQCGDPVRGRMLRSGEQHAGMRRVRLL